jgi:hypothetical protein
MPKKHKYKKYILFQNGHFYPAGGLGDIKDSFDTLPEAIYAAETDIQDMNEIIDRDTWEQVWQH